MEVPALDGRFITLVGAEIQTDWEGVEQSLSLSCQIQKEIEDPQLLQAEVVSSDTVADSSEEPGDEKIPQMEHYIPCVGPPRLIAYRPEQKQSPHGEKVPEVESKQDMLLAQCEYCQQLCRPFTHCELLGNETHFEEIFCCEQAKRLRELIMAEREKLEKECRQALIMREKERDAFTEQAKDRWRSSQHGKKPKEADLGRIVNKLYYRLSKEIPCIYDEPPIPQRDSMINTSDLFTLQEETDGEPKLKKVITKFYKSGNFFLILCPDRSGTVFYPSGNAAIIISSAGAADFTYIILEDKDVDPSIKGIFTSKGHATCYHPNGTMRLNLTPAGGLCFSETGALSRRWNWLYLDTHVRDLPFKPLTFALCPHISVRIHTQEYMFISFAHQQNHVRFNVGSKLKLIDPERYATVGQGALERYVQEKRSEIYSLLDQMQTCLSLPSASPRNIKPHYRFTAQRQRLSRQMEDTQKDKSLCTLREKYRIGKS